MTAGVPGTGVGGLFYLLAAMMLPVRGLWKRSRGEPVSWRTVGRQGLLVAGILLGLAATGWLLGFVMEPRDVGSGVAWASGALPPDRNVVRWIALVTGLLTLALVLLAVQVARLFARPVQPPVPHPQDPSPLR